MRFFKLLFVFVFSFITLSSFSSGAIEVPKDTTQQTITVSFENPKMIIQDHREISFITDYLRHSIKRDSMTLRSFDHIATAINNLTSSQERRCGSILDQLSKRTKYSPEDIKKLINRKRVINIITLFLAFLFFLIALINSFGDKIKRPWKVQAGVFLTNLLVHAVLLSIIYYMLVLIFNKDLYYIIQLLNLSG